MTKKWPLLSTLVLVAGIGYAQPVQLPAKLTESKKTERQRLEKMVHTNMALPLADSTALAWESAFWAMELMRYKPAFAKQKIQEGFTKFNMLDGEFQRAFLEWMYTNYPKEYAAPLRNIFDTATNHKIKTICGEYLLAANAFTKAEKDPLMGTLSNQFPAIIFSPWILQFRVSLNRAAGPDYFFLPYKKELTHLLLEPGFLPGQTVVLSFQRRNRNYPGLALVRDTAGRFIKSAGNTYFSVPQLARSITNMPGYLTNGNTPSGILRMDGFAVSDNTWIGPTENLQLSLPGELGYAHFFKDSTLTGTAGTADTTAVVNMLQRYRGLFPRALQVQNVMEQAFFAGWCGRTEIIAHGTTINPEYYRGATYYPQTPTMGCLCTRETWDLTTGRRQYSDQQKLVDAVKKAGGANGYFVVIELDNQQKPVTLTELLPYLKKAGAK